MQIIEQTLVPKSPTKKSEDGVVVTPDFIAVIDGSTSKTDRRYSLFSSNGRYAMTRIERVIRKLPKDASLLQFCRLATKAIRSKYRKSDLPRLADHPEERLAASAIVYSRLRREIWMIGDCQCLVNGELYENPKPYESILAEHRATEARRLMAAGVTASQLQTDDQSRRTIIPEMLQAMKQQNQSYAVIDGFNIPIDKVRVITLTFDPFELVLASDGYPFLLPTLAESEAALATQLANDPLNIDTFKATKGLMNGNISFDDRTYIRFKV